MKKIKSDLAVSPGKNSLSEQSFPDLLVPILHKLQHDLNQPLSAIMLYLQGSIRRIESDNYEKEKLLHVMQQILQQSQRIEQIIKDLKSNSEIDLSTLSCGSENKSNPRENK